MSDPAEGTVTWGELLDETTAQLRSAVGEQADSDARRIVATAAGVGDAELFMVSDRPATERGVAHLDSMVARRVHGEPLQYVLGSWAFRTLDLMVDRRVLIPRPETEQVVEVALAELDRVGGRDRDVNVVDLGTGSGAIALSIAVERVRAQVFATDVSPGALEVATANVAGLGRPGARVRLLAGSWFEPLPEELRGTVDLIVSNPPYVATTIEIPDDVARWEPAGALWSGPDGLDDLRQLVGGAGEWLTDEGALVCEMSPEQTDDLVALATPYFAEVRVAADLSGRDRTLVAARPLRR